MIRSFLFATLITASTLTVTANAATRGLARSVSNIDTVRFVQSHLLWSTDKTLNVNSVSVGDTINGLKINYIGCILQDKTYLAGEVDLNMLQLKELTIATPVHLKVLSDLELEVHN